MKMILTIQIANVYPSWFYKPLILHFQLNFESVNTSYFFVPLFNPLLYCFLFPAAPPPSIHILKPEQAISRNLSWSTEWTSRKNAHLGMNHLVESCRLLNPSGWPSAPLSCSITDQCSLGPQHAAVPSCVGEGWKGKMLLQPCRLFQIHMESAFIQH